MAMFKFVVSFVTIATCVNFFVKPITAHTLRVNEGISLDLHIEPDDTPVAKQKTAISIEFTDASQKFQIETCDCWVYLIQDEKVVSSQLIEKKAQNGVSLTAQAWVTFPSKGSYQIRVIGNPIIHDDFPNFDLSYDFQVEHEVTQVQPSQEGTASSKIQDRRFWMYGLAGSVVVVLFLSSIAGYFLRVKRKHKIKNS